MIYARLHPPTADLRKNYKIERNIAYRCVRNRTLQTGTSFGLELCAIGILLGRKPHGLVVTGRCALAGMALSLPTLWYDYSGTPEIHQAIRAWRSGQNTRQTDVDDWVDMGFWGSALTKATRDYMVCDPKLAPPLSTLAWRELRAWEVWLYTSGTASGEVKSMASATHESR